MGLEGILRRHQSNKFRLIIIHKWSINIRFDIDNCLSYSEFTNNIFSSIQVHYPSIFESALDSYEHLFETKNFLILIGNFVIFP